MEIGSWLKPLGDTFLGLDSNAAIRHVIGVIEIAPDVTITHLQGLKWLEFVEKYAEASAQEGLRYGWQAIAEQQLAPIYWPLYFPFKPGVIARIRPVTDDPDVAYVVHLSTDARYAHLNTLLGQNLATALARTVKLGNHVYRGVPGPLTDLQVQTLSEIVRHAGLTEQLFEDLRAQILLPATQAPIPQPLRELLHFCHQDFASRRAKTHQIRIECSFSDAAVYCSPGLREVVKRILISLIDSVVENSTITMTDELTAEDQAVRLMIRYRTQEPNMRVTQTIDPLALDDARRFEKPRLIERLVSATHARLLPVSGAAWAEPLKAGGVQIVMVIPRWKGTC